MLNMSCFALQGLSNKVSLHKFHLGYLTSHGFKSYDVHIVLESYSNEANDESYSVHILELNLTSYSFPNSKPPNFKFVWYSYDINEKSILLAFFMTF